MQRLRRKTDGQLGFLTEVDGEKRVRLDRGVKVGADQSTVVYREQEWVPDREVGPNPYQVARLLYAIDREYRMTLGGEYTVPEWTRLDERSRVRGFVLPESATGLRRALHEAVKAALVGTALVGK